MSNFSETCKLLWNQDKSLMSLLVYSTSQMAPHISLLNTLLTGRALDSETVYQTTESKHVLYSRPLLDKLSDSFVNYYLTYEEFRTI